MTKTATWNLADTRQMDLYRFINGMTEYKVYDNTNFNFLGKTYADVVDYSYQYNGQYYDFGILGTGLTVNTKGELTGGVVTGTIDWAWDAAAQEWFYTAYMTNFAIAATTFFAPYLTTGRADDHAGFRQILAGNDLRIYSDYSDYGYGGAGDDTMNGGGGNDTLNGENGMDLLRGQAGTDRLFGGAGNDEIIGGAGNDQLFGGTEQDKVWGGSNNDAVNGGYGNDRLHGGDGADTLAGSNGGDHLLGELGNDILRGGAGQDTLSGGQGADTLNGGSSADVFQFRSGTGTDRITDFQNGFDRLQVFVATGTALNFGVHYANGNATVQFLNDTVVLADVAVNSITLADFDVVLF